MIDAQMTKGLAFGPMRREGAAKLADRDETYSRVVRGMRKSFLFQLFDHHSDVYGS